MKTMTRTCSWMMMLAVILLASCRQNHAPVADVDESDSIEVEDSDSTYYGVAGESGMSTFCLITNDGDTLLVTKDSEMGEYGTIFGDVNEGDRFSMTTRDNGESLGVAINLSQLDRFALPYDILNGQLYLDGQQVTINDLESDSLVVTWPDGKVEKFLPKEK